MKMIESICRTYLWTANTLNSKKALISWAKLCSPTVAGGQNIINMVLWNQATILKLLWVVTKEKESLWIKWLQVYYMKGQSVEVCSIPTNATWVLRKIVEVQKIILNTQHLQGDLNSRLALMVHNGRFSIKKMYISLLPIYQKMPRKSIVLHPIIHPRFKFTCWLDAWQRVATADRLLKIGIHVPLECSFCNNAMETVEHLFFDWTITKDLWARLLIWLGFTRSIDGWKNELLWVNAQAKGTSGKGALVSCYFVTLVALLWRERNKIRFEQGQLQVDKFLREIAYHLHVRAQTRPRWKAALTLIVGIP
ncbi:hypothetical protein KY284_036136 [Solanum tuberosum]|nr:hypothetical protein KY284_036136 [Solanum tuberosum]